MRLSVCIYFIGQIILFVGIAMLLTSAVGIYYNDGSWDVLAVSGIMLIGIGSFPVIFVPKASNISLKEAIFIVCGAWLAASALGALPFYLYGNPFNMANALFESFSGFTTTGSSILTEIESLPQGILFWRSLTHWLGGSGIIVFVIAILPAMGGISYFLIKQEHSSFSEVQVSPRAKTISRIIVLVYVGLTILETVFLMFGGLSLFDASTTAFGTIATGGFSVRNLSIAAYGSVYVEIVVIVFMVLAGMNFAYLFVVITTGRWKAAGFETSRFYILYLTIFSLLITLSLRGNVYESWGSSLRYAVFQAVSLGTSAGFATADSSVWTPSAKLILVFLTLVCACSGSTSGGIKVDRMLLFLKLTVQKLMQFVHPRMIGALRIDKNIIEDEVAWSSMNFIVFYMIVIFLGTLSLSFMNVNLTEAFTGTAACMGNVGPGMGAVGSMGNFSGFPDAAKLILCVVMMMGRLEIFVFILPFTKVFWKV